MVNGNQIKKPHFRELIIPTLKILSEGKEIHARDINSKLTEELKNNFDVSTKQDHRTILEYQAAWARSYLKACGVIKNPVRGYWELNTLYKEIEIEPEEVIARARKSEVYPLPPLDVKSENFEKNVPSEKHISSIEKDIFSIESNNEERIKKLAEEYENNNVTLFLGAGVSMDARLPSWPVLIENFEKHILDEDDGKREDFFKRHENRTALTQTRMIKSQNPGKFMDSLKKAIYPSDIKELDENIKNSNLLRSLVELIKPIKTEEEFKIKDIITLNFDDVLERKMKESDIKVNSFPESQDALNIAGMPNIYHVHGYLPFTSDGVDIGQINKIIFSEEGYHDIYNNPLQWSNIIQINSFYKNTCLFVGCSLDDPNTKRLLDASKIENENENENKTTIKHYAILEKKLELLPKYIVEKIESLDYDNIEYSYKSLFVRHKENGFEIKDEFRKAIEDSERFEIKKLDDYFATLGVHIIWVNHYSEVPSILKKIR